MAFVDDIMEAETRNGEIKVYGAEGFEGMRRAGRLAAECLDMLVPHVVPGVSTEHLDRLARAGVEIYEYQPTMTHARIKRLSSVRRPGEGFVTGLRFDATAAVLACLATNQS